jgi:hypothetical protein
LHVNARSIVTIAGVDGISTGPALRWTPTDRLTCPPLWTHLSESFIILTQWTGKLMRITAAISIVLLATSGANAEAAKFQDRVAAASTATLAVGTDGVVRPFSPPDQPLQVVGSRSQPGSSIMPGTGTKDIDHPCPGAPVLDRNAAQELIRRVAAQENFFPEFVRSVSKIESAFVSTAFSGRAYGLMQLTPATAERFRVDLCDPEDNVRGGVRFLRQLHARFRNPFYVLAAYNAGEQALIERNGLPPFHETLTYIARVMDDFHQWPALTDGSRGDGLAAADARAGGLIAPRQRIGTTTASLSGDRRRPAGRAPASPAPGPVDWKSGFVANFD